MNEHIDLLLAQQRVQNLRAEAARDALARLCTTRDAGRSHRAAHRWWRGWKRVTIAPLVTPDSTAM